MPRADAKAATQPTEKKPPVPRARRAAPRSQSAGALARDVWSRRHHTRNCAEAAADLAKDAAGSDTSFARVHQLDREKEALENQEFRFGPPRRAPSVGPVHARKHSIDRESETNVGMPWALQRTTVPAREQDAGRRHVLKKEAEAAFQAFEFDPHGSLRKASRERCAGGSHGRVALMEREQAGEHRLLVNANVATRTVSTSSLAADTSADRGAQTPASGREHSAPANFGRRNVLMREGKTQSLDMPRASGAESNGLPTYGRKRVLHATPPSAALICGRPVAAH
mmetsp:Transcript_102187/g.288665  ORF Transcript_102187/g.288665 Transcript_102187/m.288665 type:complete len:283 (-) Transcript_102187:180-1028(-)|eukprot:CAMPEP_0117539340 /NCGR_PEP_ID=MMETSP0784-20121206/42935_1 /TAXON_ID=39447 /ORGANISM="" /LENGTH=282 /DNA_ID=CAMNT_0005335965 /DNA_START=43 /DNA_END=891 /DNA_ORIENTATION=-